MPTVTSSSLRWRWLVWLAPLVVLLHVSPVRTELDRAFFDLASRHPWREPKPPANSAIVLVDEETLAAASRLDGRRWPFPRWAFAGMIAALDRAGAAQIIVDFTFFEPSDRADFDAILAGVAAAVPSVVLGRTAAREPVFWDKTFRDANPSLFQRTRTGAVDFQPDGDGICRHYQIAGSL